MSISVIFLGTSASVPTAKRSLPCIALRRKGENILFDCGEGAQRHFLLKGLGVNRRMKVFLTHFHGDHVLGLPGLIQTLSLLGRELPLEVYGPEGMEEFVNSFKKVVRFSLTFPLKVYEVKEGVVYEGKEYVVEAVEVDHTIPCLAYGVIEKPRPGKFHPEKARFLRVPEGPLWKALQDGFSVKLGDGSIVKPEDVMGPPRPGLKIIYSGDTRPCGKIREVAYGADLLIHDSTFDDSLLDKAWEEGHSTASQAAQIAKDVEAKMLILTHISARYEDPSILLEQAKKSFQKVKIAEDFMEINLSAIEPTFIECKIPDS